jgi:hypothetical protein
MGILPVDNQYYQDRRFKSKCARDPIDINVDSPEEVADIRRTEHTTNLRSPEITSNSEIPSEVTELYTPRNLSGWREVGTS